MIKGVIVIIFRQDYKNVVLKAFSSNPSLCKDKMVLMREVLTIFWQGQTNIFHLSLDIYFVSGIMCLNYPN